MKIFGAKSRVTYDSLPMAQWVSGFCSIIRDQNDVRIKNHMLSYAADLREDCHDFGGSLPKGSMWLHSVKWRRTRITGGNRQAGPH